MPVQAGSSSSGDAYERDTSDFTSTAERPVQPDTTLRLYAIVRGDLEMTPGKMAAQAGHAFVEALYDAETNWDEDSVEYQDYLSYKQERPGTKVVLVAPDEATLRAIGLYAEDFVPTGFVVDSGHVMPPHFDGKPILTAVGLGPITRAKAASLLPKLALAP